MSASPILFPPSQISQPVKPRARWMPVLFALIFICFTSTAFMGGSHTQIVVDAVWQAILGKWHADLTGDVNEYLRKVGHFLGYGMIGLLFRAAWEGSARAWKWSVRSWILPFSALAGVLSIAIVASLDEWHQMFLPGRVGCVRDVLLDSAGAIFLNAIYWFIAARRRKRLSGEATPIAVLPHRNATSAASERPRLIA